MSVASFSLLTLILAGRAIGQTEDEIHRTMERYGDVVQVMSTYKRHPCDSDEIDERGIDAFTLAQNDGCWWIVFVA